MISQLSASCRLSRWDEEEEEALLCTGVDILLTGVALLSSELMVRPWGPRWWYDMVSTSWLCGPPSALGPVDQEHHLIRILAHFLLLITDAVR